MVKTLRWLLVLAVILGTTGPAREIDADECRPSSWAYSRYWSDDTFTVLVGERVWYCGNSGSAPDYTWGVITENYTGQIGICYICE